MRDSYERCLLSGNAKVPSFYFGDYFGWNINFELGVGLELLCELVHHIIYILFFYATVAAHFIGFFPHSSTRMGKFAKEKLVLA